MNISVAEQSAKEAYCRPIYFNSTTLARIPAFMTLVQHSWFPCRRRVELTRLRCAVNGKLWAVHLYLLASIVYLNEPVDNVCIPVASWTKACVRRPVVAASEAMASKSTMVGRLEAYDIAIIVVYFVVVIGFGLWVSSHHQWPICDLSVTLLASHTARLYTSSFVQSLADCQLLNTITVVRHSDRIRESCFIERGWDIVLHVRGSSKHDSITLSSDNLFSMSIRFSTKLTYYFPPCFTHVALYLGRGVVLLHTRHATRAISQSGTYIVSFDPSYGHRTSPTNFNPVDYKTLDMGHRPSPQRPAASLSLVGA